MALRASREVGQHTLRGDKRLFERPQEELLRMLRQLGAEVEVFDTELRIKSQGGVCKATLCWLRPVGAVSSRALSCSMLGICRLTFLFRAVGLASRKAIGK